MMNKQPTHSSGDWTWNGELLASKVVTGDIDDCWGWTGAQGPHGNLFGAWKLGKQQMTQATRLLYIQDREQDIDGYMIRHACGNKYCTNPRHFAIQEDNRNLYASRR